MKRWVIAAILILVASFVAVEWLDIEPDWLRGGQGTSDDELPPLSDQPYIRAAHWFGEGWPVNFWHTDLESVARDHFQLMLDDGFNAVVFLVPWPGFAPDPHSGELDAQRLERLRGLMLLADEMGLKTIVRLSYAWDWLDRGSGARLMRIWLDDSYYQGWLDYIEALWSGIEDVPGFQFGFFSWEDLWAITGLGDAGEGERREAARKSGFSRWLIEEHGLESAREHYGLDAESEQDISVPQRRDPAYALFLEFVSQSWVDRFFKPARERFPALSMEIRIDSDPIYDGDRIVEWHDHRPNWELPGAEWVTLYWSPAMGGENRGEELSPETGSERLQWWLEQVSEHAGSRQIFIGQFLFEDFTPGYEDNGRIPHDQLPEFLAQAAEVLQHRSGGVGVWAWADYGHDAIANPEFLAGMAGWEAGPDAELVEGSVRLEGRTWIATDLARFAYTIAGQPDVAELCVTASAPEEARLRAYEDEAEQPVAVLEFSDGEQRQCAEHDLAARRLRLESENTIMIHRVHSTGFVQRSGIRDRDFELKPIGRAYRKLNSTLKNRPRMLRPRYDDGWMGRVLLEDHQVDDDNSIMVLRTHLPEDWPESPMLTVSVDGEHIANLPCGSEGVERLVLPDGTGAEGPISVRIESSAVHRPSGDARQLGCHIVELSFSPEDGRPGAEPGS